MVLMTAINGDGTCGDDQPIAPGIIGSGMCGREYLDKYKEILNDREDSESKVIKVKAKLKVNSIT